jgi:O-antigen ligase
MYFLAVAASYIVADSKTRAMDEIVEQGKSLVIIYTILFSLRTWENWKQAVWFLILTTTVICLLGVYQVIAKDYTQDFFRFSPVSVEGVYGSGSASTPRIGGPVHDPNFWSMIIVAVMPLVMFRIVHEPRLNLKLLYSGILSVLFIVMMNTYSRGGYLAFFAVVFLAFFVFEKRFHPVLAVVGYGLLLILMPLLPASYRGRLESLPLMPSSSSENVLYQDSSLQGRSSVMQTGLAMFSYNPLLGVGTGNFQNNYQKYNQLIGVEYEYGERDPHSLYTQLLAETGILGTVTFLGVILSTMNALNKTIRSIRPYPSYSSYLPWIVAFQTSICGYLVASMFLHANYIRYFWILIALSLTAIQLIDERLNSDGYA